MMKTKVHLNLNQTLKTCGHPFRKKCACANQSVGRVTYSIRRGKAPTAHQHAITLVDVEWHVGASGLANVRKRGVRQVFAWAKGHEVSTEEKPVNAERIAFNPFKEGQFVWVSDRVPCGSLSKVHFTPLGAFATR